MTYTFFIGNEKSENLKNRLIYSLVVLKIEIERPDGKRNILKDNNYQLPKTEVNEY